jgi:methyl-accepting chemotaxis protein
MSAPATLSDHNLEERIFGLQKLCRDADFQAILEEAAQLCNSSRHLEAAALVEKAEAMRPAVPRGQSAVVQPTDDLKGELASSEHFATELVADVASGLAKVLLGAMENLQTHITGENRRMTSAFSERLDRLQAAVEGLQPLNTRMDQLIQTEAAVQEKYEQLAQTVATLQEAGAQHESMINGLGVEFRAFATSTSDRMNHLWGRIEGQDRTLSEVNSSLLDVTEKVAAAAQRLERHAGAIRSFHHVHKQRQEAFGELAEAFSRIASSPVPDVSANEL